MGSGSCLPLLHGSLSPHCVAFLVYYQFFRSTWFSCSLCTCSRFYRSHYLPFHLPPPVGFLHYATTCVCLLSTPTVLPPLVRHCRSGYASPTACCAAIYRLPYRFLHVLPAQFCQVRTAPPGLLSFTFPGFSTRSALPFTCSSFSTGSGFSTHGTCTHLP